MVQIKTPSIDARGTPRHGWQTKHEFGAEKQNKLTTDGNAREAGTGKIIGPNNSMTTARPVRMIRHQPQAGWCCVAGSLINILHIINTLH